MNTRLLACSIVMASFASGCSTPSKQTPADAREAIFRSAVFDMVKYANAEAVQKFQRGCDMSDHDSCLILEKLKTSIAKKREVPKGTPKLRCTNSESCFQKVSIYNSSYEVACTKGDDVACKKLGVQLYLSDKKDEAEKVFQKLCDHGSMSGCTGLGMIREDSFKWVTAKELFVRACNGGHIIGCDNLAKNEFQHGDKKVAREIWKSACDKNYFPSCANLVAWEGADGATLEMKVSMFKEYCARGDLFSCFAVSHNRTNDWPELKRRWRQACVSDDYLTCGYYAFAFDQIENAGVSTETAIGAAFLFGGAGAGFAASQSKDVKKALLLRRPSKAEL